MKFPRLLWLADNELFDLLELMDSEDTPGVLAMSTSLFSEAGRVACEPLREILGVQPLTSVVSRDWLLGCRDKEEFLFFVAPSDLV